MRSQRKTNNFVEKGENFYCLHLYASLTIATHLRLL